MRTHAKVTKKTVEGGRLGAGYGEIQGTKRNEAGVLVCEERHSPLGSCFTGQLGNHSIRRDLFLRSRDPHSTQEEANFSRRHVHLPAPTPETSYVIIRILLTFLYHIAPCDRVEDGEQFPLNGERKLATFDDEFRRVERNCKIRDTPRSSEIFIGSRRIVLLSRLSLPSFPSRPLSRPVFY